MAVVRRDKLGIKMAPVKFVTNRSNHASCKLYFFKPERNLVDLPGGNVINNSW